MADITTLAYVSAQIDFTGYELRVTFAADSGDGTLPADGTIYPFDSVGVPDLRDSGNLRIPLVYKTCDTRLNRTTGDITVYARYEIPAEYLEENGYIVKGASGYTFSMAAGMCSEEGGMETGAASAEAVTNNSEVGANGWYDFDSMGYNEGSGHKTMYCNPDRADDSGDGFSWAAAKKTLAAVLTLANAQTNNLPHRILFANGKTIDGATGSKTMNRSGASATSRIWIGGGDSGDGSTVRPIVKWEDLYCTGDNFHLNGLRIGFGTGASVGNAVAQLGAATAANTSMSDCVIEFPQVVVAVKNHRNVYTGNGTVNPMSAFQGGQATEFSDIHIVNCETDKAAATVSGHVTYDIGETGSGDAVQTGSIVFQRNIVIGRVGMRDMGRARAETLFRSMACVIGFDTGSAPTCGVDQVNSPTCTYDHASRTLTRNSGTTSNCHVWANNTYLFAASGTGVTPGYFQVASITGTTFVLSGAGLGAGADASANVVIRIGDIPGRSRNQNFRHVFNLDAGNYFTNDWFTYPNPLPYFRDTAGYWFRDSGGTGPSRNNSNPRGGPSGGQRSSDGGDVLIDTHQERFSALRMQGFGIDLQPKTYSAENQAQTWKMRKSILDGFGIVSERNLIRTSSLQTAGGAVNHNVYSNPTAAAAFCYTNTHPDQNQTFANWKTSTGWDANSVQIATVALACGTATTDSPDAEDYDALRPDCAWGETGSTGTRERLANAMAARPAGQWDYNLTAQAMNRWLLAQIKPTDRSTWVTEPAGDYGYIGAADYTLEAPTDDSVYVSNTSAVVFWAAPTDGKVVAHKIMYGTVSGTLDNELWVYIDDHAELTSLLPSTEYFYRIYASDGHNLSEPTAEGSFTTQAVEPVASDRIYGLTSDNVANGSGADWVNPDRVNGAASGDYANVVLANATSDFCTGSIAATPVDGTIVGFRLGAKLFSAAAPSPETYVKIILTTSGGLEISESIPITITNVSTEYEVAATLQLPAAVAKAAIEAGISNADSTSGVPTGISVVAYNAGASTDVRCESVWVVPLLAGGGGDGDSPSGVARGRDRSRGRAA